MSRFQLMSARGRGGGAKVVGKGTHAGNASGLDP